MGTEGSGPAAGGAALLAENQQLRRQLAEAKLLATRVTTDTATAAEGQRAALATSRREVTGARQEARQAHIDGARAASNHRAAAAAGRAELAGSEALNAALQASEGRLRLVLESATDFAIVTIDLDGYLTGWNIGARNILGWEEAEALGRDARMFWTPEDRAAGVFEAEMRAAREQGRADDERWHLRRDGSRFWASGEMMPLLREEDETLLGFLKILRDRTEQRRAGEALRLRAEEFQTLADNIPTLCWMAHADGHIHWFNRRWYEYTGSSPDNQEGWGWESVHDPRTLPEVVGRWQHSLATGEPFEMTFPLRGADGVFRPFLTRVVPIRGAPDAEHPEGRIARWFGTNTDVSPQAAAKEALRTSEARLHELVGTLDLSAVMVRDLDGTIRFWSRGCERLYGWTAKEAVGRSAHELLRIEFPLPPAEIEAALLREGEWRGDLRHVRRDGTSLVVAAHRALRRDEAGRAAAVVESLADVTALRRAQAELERLNAELEGRVEARTAELRRAVDALHAEARERAQAEESLRQAQKMEAVGQLTGGLAHDFNNLLTGISGSLERLQARLSQGRVNDLERYIVVAQGAAKRAAALTHRLLAFSRRQTLDPKPTSVNRLVAGMEELVRRTVGPAITVEVVAAGGLWATLIDPGQLENALLNLCINARDAMPDGGRLTIETGNKWLDQRAARERDLAPGQYVSLCISDTGLGMTPDVVARAFDPFFTTKPIGMGTGLGLSMVYGFAQQSGGQARIYSEPGQGAMVCLYLPRHHGGVESADELDDTRNEAPHVGQGETVLVVDDEPAVRMLVAEVLEDLGCTAIEAEDGAAGLRVLRSDARIDLLITDVGLPGGLNGRQVADVARAARPGLRVLFITGYAENAVVGNGHLEPGMQVLTKPFAMETLANRVRDLMAQPHEGAPKM